MDTRRKAANALWREKGGETRSLVVQVKTAPCESMIKC